MYIVVSVQSKKIIKVYGIGWVAGSDSRTLCVLWIENSLNFWWCVERMLCAHKYSSCVLRVNIVNAEAAHSATHLHNAWYLSFSHSRDRTSYANARTRARSYVCCIFIIIIVIIFSWRLLFFACVLNAIAQSVNQPVLRTSICSEQQQQQQQTNTDTNIEFNKNNRKERYIVLSCIS